MKFIGLLTIAFTGLALVSAMSEEDASINAAYQSAYGYYDGATVISGPTDIDEFGMPINSKRTDAPDARDMGSNGFNDQQTGNDESEHEHGYVGANIERSPPGAPATWAGPTGVGGGAATRTGQGAKATQHHNQDAD